LSVWAGWRRLGPPLPLSQAGFEFYRRREYPKKLTKASGSIESLSQATPGIINLCTLERLCLKVSDSSGWSEARLPTQKEVETSQLVKGNQIMGRLSTYPLRLITQPFWAGTRSPARSVGSLTLHSHSQRERIQNPLILISAFVLIAVLIPSYCPIEAQQVAERHTAEARSGHYRFVTLDVVPQDRGFTVANGINNERTVVGEFLDDSTDFQFHGFIYSHGEYFAHDVPVDGATNTELFGINNRGEIVGVYQKPGTGGVISGLISVGFLYDHGAFRDISHPNAPCGIFPRGINDAEAMAGYYFDVDCNSHGFLMEHGNFFSLDVPDSVVGLTRVYGLNNRGEVVGTYVGFDDAAHGFIYLRGRYTTLDHPVGANGGTVALAINNLSDVTGFYFDETDNFTTHGFVYSRGRWETIDVPGANSGTQIFGINDHGDLAGFYGVNVPAPPDQCKVPPCFDLEIHGFVATRIPGD
jgi:hypothetical protein